MIGISSPSTNADRAQRAPGGDFDRDFRKPIDDDGGETALAVAYDRFYLDRRVDASIILSGAEIPGVGGFDFPAPSPPLLASQGTADSINQPRS